MDLLFHKTPKVPPIPEDAGTSFNGKVIIIGAGVAGLMAGNVLEKLGVDYEILEASNCIGGRMCRTDDFGDIPIDVGPEFVHLHPDIGKQIPKQLLVFQDGGGDDDLDTDEWFVEYNPQTLQFAGGRRDWFRHLYMETRFKSKTWHQWLETYVYKHCKGKVRLNAVVKEIQYMDNGNTSNLVKVTTEDGKVYTANKVICAVPLGVLKSGSIKFQPELPKAKKDLMDQIQMQGGVKMFFEMKTKFYADFSLFGNFLGLIKDGSDNIIGCWDEYLNRDVPANAKNVLGFAAVGRHYDELFKGCKTRDEMAKIALEKIDALYGGDQIATKNCIKYIVKDWSNEPYIRGAWTKVELDGRLHKRLGETVNDNLLFAGEAYHPVFASYVQGAALSGRRAAVEAVSGIDIEQEHSSSSFTEKNMWLLAGAAAAVAGAVAVLVARGRRL